MPSRSILPVILGALALACLAAPAGGEALRGSFAARLLELHNDARDDEGLPALRWSAELARAAEPWARQLASEGRLRHASRAERGEAGENLWMGTAGFFGPDEMMDRFLEEERMFRPGTFPDVSTTGRWQDVAHYTQIIWPQTEQVGCALASGREMEVLVCRYWPAGNYFGRPVGRQAD